MTTAPARRSRALIALAAVIGLLVAIAAYSYGSASDRTPTARVQMVLDEDQTGWPFYAAVQEEAEAFLRDGDALGAARERAGVSSGEIRVDRPGDLSVFSVVATASDDATAIALADAGAVELIERSQASRRSTESADLAALDERRSALLSELDTISATVNALDPSDQSAEAVLARGSLDSVGREFNDVERAIGDLESAIEATGPAYRAIGPATIDEQATSALLTAITAGAAAAILSLLALSFLAGPAIGPSPATGTARREPSGGAVAERPNVAPTDDDRNTSDRGTSQENDDSLDELDLRSPAPVARSSAFGDTTAAKSPPAKPVAKKPAATSASKPPSKPTSRPPSTNGGAAQRPVNKSADSTEPTRSTRRTNRKR